MPKIRFKRGLEEKLPLLSEGEPGFTTDTEKLFIGASEGNVEFAKKKDVDINTSKIAEHTSTLENLSHVDANAEMLEARGTYPVLGDRLNDVTTQLADTKKLVMIDVTKYGAVGDGITNDTQACMDAFTFALSIESIPKEIVFPTGSYLIDGDSPGGGDANFGRLRIPSNTVINLCGSTVTMVPNDRPNSSLFRATDKKNIVVKNGFLYGDYVEPNTKPGQWQYGVSFQSCKGVTIDNVKCYNMRGDGLYFAYTDVANKNENILVNNCYVSTVWRNGISVTSGKNVVIQNTTVENTVANILGSGIDFEPDADVDANYIENALVINCKFNNIIGTGSAIRFQYSKNCKAINNRITNSDIGTEARQCYNIEYLKNEFVNVKGIMLNGYSTGEIIFDQNTVSFYSGAPSGYNAFHFNIIGASSAVRISNNKFISAVAPLLYATAPITYIYGNEFSKCDPVDSTFEYLRPKSTAKVYFYSNKIIFNDGHSVFADIRVRDNSVCYIKNNITLNGSLLLVNSETGVYTTDIFTGIPTFGTYNRGDSISNKTPSAGSYMGWVCTTTGTANNTAWVASTSYLVGNRVNANGKVYECTVAGTSGTTAPSHTSGTASDGTVTWSYISTLAVFKGYGVIQA